MRIAICLASFLALAILPALTPFPVTKTGPMPVYEHGGGGGP